MARLLSEAVAAFDGNGVPVAHVRFRDKRSCEPPYAHAYLNGSSHTFADDRTSRTLCDYDFVLHARDRDLALEGLIEDALDASDITWAKSGGYMPDSDLVTTTYRFEVYER